MGQHSLVHLGGRLRFEKPKMAKDCVPWVGREVDPLTYPKKGPIPAKDLIS
jgi:hypothetical protein